MSPSKAKELNNRKDGDRSSCSICVPQRGVSMDKVWEWSQAHPGVSPWRNDVS
jgi:hypothetical protein